MLFYSLRKKSCTRAYGDNGDSKVAEAASPCRESIQSPDWVGHVIGSALDIDTSTKAGRAKVSGILNIWLTNGMFRVVEGEDAKRMTRKFVEVGEWSTT